MSLYCLSFHFGIVKATPPPPLFFLQKHLSCRKSVSFSATSFDREQCDQTVRLSFNIWPLPTMKISPTQLQICQSRLNILPNTNLTVKNLPKTCKMLPYWQFLPNLVTLIESERERERESVFCYCTHCKKQSHLMMALCSLFTASMQPLCSLSLAAAICPHYSPSSRENDAPLIYLSARS